MGEALCLGLLHGPTELAPVSSSGHLTVVPFLAGWEYSRLDPDLRKSFEVALHAGTAAALLLGLRAEVADALGQASPRTLGLLALSFLPPAAVGYLGETEIEAKLGSAGSVALGLIVGGLALAWADSVSAQARGFEDATAADALWLG
ncbi:MAG: hypothetical protein J2O48_11030, partial [Solirubrobacterales bacterium]|nr:hypothetical protein [Solirubrobacterales bacterium]